MTVSLTPEVVLRAMHDAQSELPLAAEGVLRWLWQGRYGSMLIEVVGEEVYVNGQRVEPYACGVPDSA